MVSFGVELDVELVMDKRDTSHGLAQITHRVSLIKH